MTYAPALIRLLQGAVYSDDEVWRIITHEETAIRAYFAQMGLELVLSDIDGYAFLTQPDKENDQGAPILLPRLTRRRALTYTVTVIIVILREELNQFDISNLDDHRLILSHEQILDKVRPFYGQQSDERTLIKMIDRDINAVIDLGFLKEIRDGRGKQIDYLVRSLLKSKVTSDDLERIKKQIEAHTQEENDDVSPAN